MNKPGSTVGKSVVGLGEVAFLAFIHLGDVLHCWLDYTRASVLSSPCAGTGLLPVQRHIGICQGHICRALLVPPFVKGIMASGRLVNPGSGDIWGQLPQFLAQGHKV